VDTILAFLKAALGIFIVMALWYGWMSWVRRKSGARKDHDVLEHMVDSCAGCQNQGTCLTRKERHRHESA